MVKYFIFAFILCLGFCGAAKLPSPTIVPTPAWKTISVMNFWATWCNACKLELKEFDKEFTGKKVNLILVNLDSDSAVGEKWLKDNYRGDYIFIADPTYKMAEEMKITSFPTTFIVDGAGQVLYTQKGFDEKSTAKLLKALNGLNW